jgi:hypothetical protein
LSQRQAALRDITIISGGQTGADRAALDFAIENGFTHGGWCPRGRVAEDGPISGRYSLRETPSRRYAQRTEWNVRDSDATVAFTLSEALTGGTGLTLRLAAEFGKPALHLARDAGVNATESAIEAAAAELIHFLDEHAVAVLNVAGPRASQEPSVGEFVRHVLALALLR